MRKRGRNGSIIPRLSNRPIRDVAERYGRDGRNDFDGHLHTRAYKSSPINSHHKRIRKIRGPHNV